MFSHTTEQYTDELLAVTLNITFSMAAASSFTEAILCLQIHLVLLHSAAIEFILWKWTHGREAIQMVHLSQQSCHQKLPKFQFLQKYYS